MNGTPSACACMTAAPRRVDRAAEDLGEELARLRLREAVDLQPADHAHAVHVGEQVHGLGHERELLGPDREHQEDRARRDGADDVAEHAQAVVVGPLQVVDQDGERPFGGEGAERDGAEVERAQQPAVGRECARGPGRPAPTSQSRLRASASAVFSSVAVRAASGEPRIERASRKGPRSSSSAVTAIVGEPVRPTRVSAAATQQPRLADPGLALDA